MSLKTGLLIGTNPKNIGNLFKSSALSESFGTLYIKLVSNVILESLLLGNQYSFTINKEAFRNTVVDYYNYANHYEHIDVRVLLSNFKDADFHTVTTSKPIDVIYFDSSYSSPAIGNFADKFVVNKSKQCQISSYPGLEAECNLYFSHGDSNYTSFKEYDHVVLGGTFDRLHLGHKLLLSESVLRCRKQLSVGVCSNSILSSKTLSEFIQDCDTRIKYVEEFLHDIDPLIKYNLFPIYDIYGPTKEDATMQAIVVSPETVRGGEKINEYRAANGLNTLDIIKIGLIESMNKSDYEENKISSSNTRIRMLGKLLKSPEPRPNLPPKPYIIGITGGIASGKSSISKHLKNLGCGYINCDEIAHKMYDIGSPGYRFILDTFGSSVINEDGSVNRKQLGNIVFNDAEKLNKLNKGIWPLVLNQIREDIHLHHKDKDVVVVEAALLVQANWIKECHEIWSCIISPDEAVKRLQARNHLSAEEAQTRINSQPKNEEYVSHSNVVFCTLWDESFTKQQVEKALRDLSNRTAFSK